MNRRPYPVLIATLFALLLLLFLYSVAEVLLLFFISVLFAVYLSAITDTLQKRLAGMPRGVGLIAAVLFTLTATIGIVYLIVPPVLTQGQGLIQAMPALMNRWEDQLTAAAGTSPFIEQLLGNLPEGARYTDAVVNQIGGYFTDVVPYLFSGFTFVIHFISVLVMGIYLALRPSMYREGFILLAPPLHRELVRDILGDLGRTLRA